MKKIVLSFLLIIIFYSLGCAQPEITARISWQQNNQASGFLLYAWEGTNTAACPFQDNMNLADLDTTGLQSFHVDSAGVSVDFQTPVNGHYLRVIGFAEYKYNMFSSYYAAAAVTAFVLKPGTPVKMQLLELRLL